MTLAGIKPGDIVRIDRKGRVFEAFVREKADGQLKIAPIVPQVTYTTASAREVIGHWGRRGRST